MSSSSSVDSCYVNREAQFVQLHTQYVSRHLQLSYQQGRSFSFVSYVSYAAFVNLSFFTISSLCLLLAIDTGVQFIQ